MLQFIKHIFSYDYVFCKYVSNYSVLWIYQGLKDRKYVASTKLS